SSVPNAQTDIVLIVMNTQPPAKKTAPESASGLYTNIQDLAGKRVAVQTGTICDQIMARVVPEAKPVYFDTQTDLVTALKTNKVEAVCTDIPIAKFMMSQYDNMTMLGDTLTEEHLAPIFAKTEAGRKLCSKFTEFTKAAWENGTIQELEAIWFGKDDSRRVVKDYSKLPAANGILKMAVDPAIVPFTYMKGSKIVGYDVDFAVRFCEKYGYGLEIMPMNFAGVIPAVMSGKCDLAISAITVTPERAESVLFSEPHANAGAAFFVRKSDTQPQAVRTSGQYNTLEEIAAKRIAVQTGTASALLVEEKLPGAKIQYFDSLADTLVALKAGKVDALASTIFSASHMVNTNNDITILNQWLRTTDISPIFTKSDRGRKLCEEYSEFLKGLWDDGTIDKLNDIWLGPDESRKIIRDYSNLPAANGTIRLAVDSSMPPLAYVRDNRVVGYDIDLAVRFCEAKGYGL
ncbi:MAG: transporter substrate-binding domain-containing protein, partial [Synergistaceae bacterium]|nr:transporter substrate-binding domain-containing protein [Synergistaceae bacterium]